MYFFDAKKYQETLRLRSRFESPEGCYCSFGRSHHLAKEDSVPMHFIRCKGKINVAHVTDEMLVGRSWLWLAGSRYGYFVAYPQSQ